VGEVKEVEVSKDEVLEALPGIVQCRAASETPPEAEK
jgi:hypothetical protein